MSSVISPFNLLLNSISNELSPQNLQSLIHICEDYIPESKREEIRNGLDVFRILKQQNVIGDDVEKLKNLKKIMKAMRPKRKDIIKRVKNFIRNYNPGFSSLSSGDSLVLCQPAADVVVDNHHPESASPLDQYSSPGLHSIASTNQSYPSVEVSSFNNVPHCSVDCCCVGCTCYTRQIPSCVLLTMVSIMAILTLLSSVLWYEKIPMNLYLKLGPDGIQAGGYVVGCLGVATIVFLSWWIYRKVRWSSHVGQIPYHSFTNDDQMSPYSTEAVKGFTNFSTSVEIPMKKQKIRRFSSKTAEPLVNTARSTPVLGREPRQLPFTPRKLRHPRRGRRNAYTVTEDGGLQTDGGCGPRETHDSYSQSRESLVETV